MFAISPNGLVAAALPERACFAGLRLRCQVVYSCSNFSGELNLRRQHDMMEKVFVRGRLFLGALCAVESAWAETIGAV